VAANKPLYEGRRASQKLKEAFSDALGIVNQVQLTSGLD